MGKASLHFLLDSPKPEHRRFSGINWQKNMWLLLTVHSHPRAPSSKTTFRCHLPWLYPSMLTLPSLILLSRKHLDSPGICTQEI